MVLASTASPMLVALLSLSAIACAPPEEPDPESGAGAIEMGASHRSGLTVGSYVNDRILLRVEPRARGGQHASIYGLKPYPVTGPVDVSIGRTVTLDMCDVTLVATQDGSVRILGKGSCFEEPVDVRVERRTAKALEGTYACEHGSLIVEGATEAGVHVVSTTKDGQRHELDAELTLAGTDFQAGDEQFISTLPDTLRWFTGTTRSDTCKRHR